MHRAPLVVSLVLGTSVALLVTLVGPLLLFNPWLTSALQDRHAVPEAFETERGEIDRVTGDILVDLYTDGAFDAALPGEPPLLTARERSHMHDVARLVRILAAVTVLALFAAVASAAMLRRERRRRGRILLVSAGTVGAIALVLAGVFAIAFEPAFLAFHAIFFPAGTYLFEPGSNLITLFPEGFWFDAALIAGGTIVVSALLVTLVGLRLWRGGPDSTDGHLH